MPISWAIRSDWLVSGWVRPGARQKETGRESGELEMLQNVLPTIAIYRYNIAINRNHCIVIWVSYRQILPITSSTMERREKGKRKC